MKNIEARLVGDNLYFRNFMVKKESDSFYGVYEKDIVYDIPTGELITSADSMNKASKKAKLLQIGYNVCRDHMW